MIEQPTNLIRPKGVRQQRKRKRCEQQLITDDLRILVRCRIQLRMEPKAGDEKGG
jgi:hypothetical protein